MSKNVNKKFIESQKEKKKSFNKIRIKFKRLIWSQLYYFFIYNYIKNLNLYYKWNIIIFLNIYKAKYILIYNYFIKNKIILNYKFYLKHLIKIYLFIYLFNNIINFIW